MVGKKNQPVSNRNMKQNPILVQSQQDKKCAKKIVQKDANQSLNQAPPVLTPYTLTTQPLPPLLITIDYF